MSSEFLDDLETRVGEAAQRLASLGERNAELERRVTELEGQLASAGDPPEAGHDAERDELRRRVEALVEQLESLLEP